MQTNREDRMKKNGRENDDEGAMTAGWIMLKSAFSILYKQSFHINVGDDIPSNIELTDVDSASKISLQEMCSSNVPLIINFGSCTWPPFMASLKKFANAKEKVLNYIKPRFSINFIHLFYFLLDFNFLKFNYTLHFSSIPLIFASCISLRLIQQTVGQ